MDPSTLLLIAAFVACPLAMGAMMWMMNKQMNERSTGADRGDLEQLRAQEEALRDEIAKLESQRHSLPIEPAAASEESRPSKAPVIR